MSTIDADVEIPDAPAAPAALGEPELTAARVARVGDIEVRRLMPLRHRRTVGAWCFVDHYGPMSVDGVAGMQVPSHPHIGLQTVTWLLDGNVLHRDSLGSAQMIRPGQLNLMTAGRGIAHSEESPAGHDPGLHGVQLWLALPGADRQVAPAFEHRADLPSFGLAGFEVTVFIGQLAGQASPATVFSPVVGAQLRARRDAAGELALAHGHEHLIFAAAGRARVEDRDIAPGNQLYLASGRAQVRLTAAAGTVLFLLGGQPLGEPLLMWWNFVGRTPADIIEATRDWARGGRFGQVAGYHGAPLAAPPLDMVRLGQSRPRS
jgi:redox-sensitive bicupin YhaK (pirin superfamily)